MEIWLLLLNTALLLVICFNTCPISRETKEAIWGLIQFALSAAALVALFFAIAVFTD